MCEPGSYMAAGGIATDERGQSREEGAEQPERLRGDLTEKGMLEQSFLRMRGVDVDVGEEQSRQRPWCIQEVWGACRGAGVEERAGVPDSLFRDE